MTDGAEGADSPMTYPMLATAIKTATTCLLRPWVNTFRQQRIARIYKATRAYEDTVASGDAAGLVEASENMNDKTTEAQ